MMTNQEVAMEHLRCFYSGDIEGLEPLLASDLSFTDTFNSAVEYLDSLRDDLPEKCGCNLLSITESEDSVALFYEYEKPDRILQMAQLFKIRDK